MANGTGFLHMVYFWLNEGAGKAEAQALAAGARKHLSAIPGVVRLEAGFPAATTRPVVDSSYGVGLLVEFGGIEDHDIYQSHPDHHRFIEECRQYWSRVQIYDTDIE